MSGPGWRDPRLWVGVAIVAASVVGGTRLFAAADDTVAVWASTAQHGAGDQIEVADLTEVRVRFAEGATMQGYYRVEEALPVDLQLSRGLEAGELLPRASIGSATDAGLVQVPVAVEPEQVPGSVGAGAVVDIYLVTQLPEGGAPAAAGPALAGVTVLEAPRPEDSFGTSGKRQLVLAVPEDAAAAFFALMGAGQSPVITVVRRG